MGGFANSTVQITISVVDAGAASTLQTTESRLLSIGTAAGTAGTGLARSTTELVGFGNAGMQSNTMMQQLLATIQMLQQSSAEMTAAAVSLSGALQEAGTSATRAGAGLEETRGKLEGVRLASEELGIRVPRAMQKIIASNELVSNALKFTMDAFIAMGAIEIGQQMVEGVYNLYEKWIDVDAAYEDYYQSVQKHKEEDIINVRSLEDANLRLREANQSMMNMKDLASAIHEAGLADLLSSPGQGITELLAARQVAGSAAKAGEQGDQISAHQIELQHQLAEAEIETQHAGDGRLQGEAKITAELQKQYDLNEERRRYTRQLDMAAGNKSATDSGRQLQQQQDEAAEERASAARAELHRRENDQIIQAQNEATNSGLKGADLLQAQEEQAIDAVYRKFQSGELSKQAMMAESAAIWTKFENQKLEMLQQEERETEKIEDQAQQAGLKGIAKVQAETNSRAYETSQDPTLNVDQKQRRIIAIYQAGDQEIEQLQKDFGQKLGEISDQSADRQLQGYARIDAEAKSHAEEVWKAFDEAYGQLDASDQKRIDAELRAQDAIVQINENADRQRAQYTERINEQITANHAKAARDILPAWQAAQQAIRDQYDQTFRKIDEDVKANSITFQQGEDEKRAALELTNAEMQKQAERTRDQLAGQLGDFFSDPGGYIKKRANDLMMQILANWLMQLDGFKNNPVIMWLFGMGQPTPTSNSQIGTLFGIGASRSSTSPWSEAIPGLTQSTTQLTSAGTTLQTSGSTLETAGTSLTSAATDLSMAAQQLQMMGTASGGLGSGSILNALAPNDNGGGLGDVLNSPDLFTGGDLSGDSSTSGIGDVWTQTESTTSGAASAAQSGGGLSLGGVVGAGMGVYGVVQSTRQGNILGAMMSGVETGASIGTMVMPGIGTAIGAAVGAIGGAISGLFGSLFGDHGRSKAVQYDQDTVGPALANELQEFEAGMIGYDQAIKDLTGVYSQAQSTTQGYGSGARSYFNNTIGPEIMAVENQIGQLEGAGRGNISFSAAQFHAGGLVSDFGDLWTSSTEGYAHLRVGERVMNPMASSSFGPLLDAMNSGALSRRGTRMPVTNGGGGSIVIQALDSKSFQTWMRQGGAMEIQKGLNANVGRYAGVSLG